MTDVDEIWQRIYDHLDAIRHRIVSEIRNYPSPIPACDAQFNYLLEERERVGSELQRLVAARGAENSRDGTERVLEFVAASRYCEEDLEQSIRTSLRGA